MYAVIQAVTPDINASLSFYQKLAFREVDKNPLMITDGKVTIAISNKQYDRTGIKLYGKDWKSIVADEALFNEVAQVENGYLVSDPNGTWVYLIEQEIDQSPGDSSFSILGNFSGISVEAIAFDQSMRFWKALGFQVTMGGSEQGWVALEQDGFGISLMKPLMCPHQFYSPSLTYFNGGKNLPVIEKIRKAGISITEEITVFNEDGLVDNVILRDPGGLGIFVFND